MTCGYGVEWLRSSYKGEWVLPELPGHIIKGRYFFNNDAPCYPGWHCFGSRNWTTAWFESDAPFGERADSKQPWDNGSFPVRLPDPVVVGSADCIENGTAGQPPLEYRWEWGRVFRFAQFAYTGVQYYPPPSLNAHGVEQPVFLTEGPFATHAAALAYCQSMPASGPVNPLTLVNFTGQVGADGWWAVLYIEPRLGPAIPQFCHGINVRCWVNGGVYCWSSSGGGQQSGTGYAPSPFQPSGGGKQSGEAAIAQGGEFNASGGTKQAGDATFASGGEWVAAGGSKEAGAAEIAGGSSWAGAGGSKQQGAATIAQGATWSAAGGSKEKGAATLSGYSKYFTQSSNTVTTCDTVGADNYDLGTSSGSGTSSWTTAINSYTERLTFDIAWTPVDGPISVSLNVTALASPRTPTFRFRVQALNSLCAVVASSAYSAEFNTTGVKTLSDSLSGTSGANRLRISLEAKRVTGPTAGTNDITNGTSSFVTVAL